MEEENASILEKRVGSAYLGKGRCGFRVWAPATQTVEVHIISPHQRIVALEQDKHGYHHAVVDGVEPGCLYQYRLDGQQERPDPASRFQPRGVHGPSQVVDPRFPWQDERWMGLPLQDYIIYELHVGTFTPEGTFEAIIPHLDELKELGITAIELMPVNQFPGSRNWGYDGVYPFAVQNSYGGAQALKRLMNTCHQKGLAVILDVVYNHLGPEGNYLAGFGPYFTDRYRTPWGPALNFDGPQSDEVRRFFLENAIYWITEFHMDALRIDAVHAIMDSSAQSFLEQLGLTVHREAERLERRVYLIPESARNDPQLVRSRELGGYGLDAQWNDDFHHALHALLTGEHTGYYQDFGQPHHLVKAFREGFVYSGEYSPYRGRKHGDFSAGIPAHCFVVFAQNHDQVGNRMGGERLSELVSLEGLKLAAGVVLLSPFIPLLFMGEEYGETAPFSYFISHTDRSLIEAVQRGRHQEFAGFHGADELPDPQDESTFLGAKLDHRLRNEGQHRILLELHRELIRLRKEIPALARLSKKDMDVRGSESAKVLTLRRWCNDSEAVAVFHFGGKPASVVTLLPSGRWKKLLDSADGRWHGPGSLVPADLTSDGQATLTLSPHAFILFEKEKDN